MTYVEESKSILCFAQLCNTKAPPHAALYKYPMQRALSRHPSPVVQQIQQTEVGILPIVLTDYSGQPFDYRIRKTECCG